MGLFDFLKRASKKAETATTTAAASGAAAQSAAAQSAAATAGSTGAGEAAASETAAAETAVSSLLGEGGANLSDLLGRLSADGLDDVVKSWIGMGENKGVGADRVRGAVAVVADVGERGAKRRLPAPSAFDRGGVDEQKVVGETGALLGKDDEQPVKHRGKTAPALEVAGLTGDVREQMGKRSPRPAKEAPIGGLTHDGLSHRQGDDLSIGGTSARVPSSFWQKIIGCAINEGAEGVEVGVHRGLLVDGVSYTADFGLSASNPFRMAIFVESISRRSS